VDVLARGERPDVLLVVVGAMASTGLEVAQRLAAQGIDTTVVDPRWVIPVDPELSVMAGEHRVVVTLEDGLRVGGVGARIAQTLRDTGVATPALQFGVPCRFIEQATRAQVLAEIGLTAQDVARAVAEHVAGLDVPHTVGLDQHQS
jgi:1-deoxy-D-xylulose-5-phosphate synthase